LSAATSATSAAFSLSSDMARNRIEAPN